MSKCKNCGGDIGGVAYPVSSPIAKRFLGACKSVLPNKVAFAPLLNNDGSERKNARVEKMISENHNVIVHCCPFPVSEKVLIY